VIFKTTYFTSIPATSKKGSQIRPKFYCVNIKYDKIFYNGAFKMRKNYFAKLVKYAKKVLNIEKAYNH
jgi:hypothetical protein